MSVHITDNSDKVLAEFSSQVKLGLQLIGTQAETYAKQNCPVDTGRLRNSIANQVEDKEVYIGTNVEYAAIVEYKDITHRVGQAHYLRDAATTHSTEYGELMKMALMG